MQKHTHFGPQKFPLVLSLHKLYESHRPCFSETTKLHQSRPGDSVMFTAMLKRETEGVFLMMHARLHCFQLAGANKAGNKLA